MALKISVIIPCFNMVSYISQTLESITHQNYENLELIIIDGGSTDGTLEILNKYKSTITHFVSEPDKGQYDAINKGMSLAKGDILCWLNADDIYLPWTLKMVSNIFRKFNDVNWIIGTPTFIDERMSLTHINGNISAKPKEYIANGLFHENLYGFLQQESMFWRKEVWETCGSLNTNYKLAADFELWTRFARKYNLVSISIPLAGFRNRTDSRSKIGRNQYNNEVKMISKSFNKKRIISYLASKGQIVNKLIRILTWKRSKIIFYSISKNEWINKDTYRPISTISFSNLLLEVI